MQFVVQRSVCVVAMYIIVAEMFGREVRIELLDGFTLERKLSFTFRTDSNNLTLYLQNLIHVPVKFFVSQNLVLSDSATQAPG